MGFSLCEFLGHQRNKRYFFKHNSSSPPHHSIFSDGNSTRRRKSWTCQDLASWSTEISAFWAIRLIQRWIMDRCSVGPKTNLEDKNDHAYSIWCQQVSGACRQVYSCKLKSLSLINLFFECCNYNAKNADMTSFFLVYICYCTAIFKNILWQHFTTSAQYISWVKKYAFFLWSQQKNFSKKIVQRFMEERREKNTAEEEKQIIYLYIFYVWPKPYVILNR